MSAEWPCSDSQPGVCDLSVCPEADSPAAVPGACIAVIAADCNEGIGFSDNACSTCSALQTGTMTQDCYDVLVQEYSGICSGDDSESTLSPVIPATTDDGSDSSEGDSTTPSTAGESTTST